MNVSSVFRRFILGAGLALTVAGMAVGAVGAQQPGDQSIAAPGRTSIVTDKESYAVGEPITITYTLPGPGRYRITDQQGGTVSTLRAGSSAQATGRIEGTVTPPAGKECLTLEYRDGKNVTSTAETCFEVTDKEPTKEDQPRGQAPAPGLYTLLNAGSGMMLDSNPEKAVYPHTPNGGAFQKWVLEAGPDSYGYFFLRDLATSYYLDGNPQGDVYTLEKNNGIYQQWKLVEPADGYFFLLNRGTGLRLRASDDAIFAAFSLGFQPRSAYQWKLTAVQP